MNIAGHHSMMASAPTPTDKFTTITINATTQYGLRWGIYSASLYDASHPAIVDWGDGSIETFTQDISFAEHEYAAPGVYAVRISDNISTLVLYYSSTSLPEWSGSYPLEIVSVVSNAKHWENLNQRAFQRAANLTEVRLYGIQGIDGMPRARAPFTGCTSLLEIHLPVASEATIKASAIWGYTDGDLGAENATIYFDL